MAGLRERANPYSSQPVSLAPISDEQVTDENLEPPFVRIRDGNESFIYADSEARLDLTDPSRYILGGKGFEFYVRKIKRLALEGAQTSFCIPNINARNNTVIFHWTLTGLDYTVTIPEGFYTTTATASAALAAAMNSAVGPGIFVATVNPLNSKQFTLAVVGPGAFHFIVGDPLSTMMTRGRALFNLPIVQTDLTSMTVGAVMLQYSRFFDIISYALTEYSKNPNTSNDHVPNGLIARVFLRPPGTADGGIETDMVGFFATDVSVSTNYNRARSLEVVDFALLDEFGMPLYQPALSTGTPPNSAITFIIKTEL